MTQSNRKVYWTYSYRYFHKVPAEAPLLELKASYGLVEPVAFELPPLSEQCTPQVYATFDLTKGAKNDKVQKFIFGSYSLKAWKMFGFYSWALCFIAAFVAIHAGKTQGRGGETSEGTRFETSERHRLYHLLNTDLSLIFIIH